MTDIFAIDARAEERKTYSERPDYVAYVRVRADRVLSIEDYPRANPKAGIQNPTEPLMVNIGCIVQLAGGAKPIKLGVMADEFEAAVLACKPKGFVRFPWVDPDARKHG